MQYCGCRPENCTACYELMASYCPSTINIPCNLTPGDQYYLWVEFLSNLYADVVTVNGDGSVYIDTANFPEIFNASSGALFVFLTVTDTPDVAVTMNFATPSTCVSLKVNNPVFLVDECDNYLTDENGNYLIA